MEGGQIKDIPLDSPIDTKSSDMIVPVEQPKFAHNRQRYQGHVLPTSLRYEHNGWAAGEQVYEFEFEGGRIPETGTEPKVELSRTRLNGNPAYILNLYKIGEDDKLAKAYFNFSTGGNCIDIDDLNVYQPVSGDRSIVTISGTFNDKEFSFKYNVLTDNLYDITEGFAVVHEGVSSGISSFRLTDITDGVSFDSRAPNAGRYGQVVLPSKLYNVEGNYELGTITSVESLDDNDNNLSVVSINNGEFTVPLHLTGDDTSNSNLAVTTNNTDIYIDDYAGVNSNKDGMPVGFNYKKNVKIDAQFTGSNVNKLAYIKDVAVSNEYSTIISGISESNKHSDLNNVQVSMLALQGKISDHADIPEGYTAENMHFPKDIISSIDIKKDKYIGEWSSTDLGTFGNNINGGIVKAEVPVSFATKLDCNSYTSDIQLRNDVSFRQVTNSDVSALGMFAYQISTRNKMYNGSQHSKITKPTGEYAITSYDITYARATLYKNSSGDFHNEYDEERVGDVVLTPGTDIDNKLYVYKRKGSLFDSDNNLVVNGNSTYANGYYMHVRPKTYIDKVKIPNKSVNYLGMGESAWVANGFKFSAYCNNKDISDRYDCKAFTGKTTVLQINAVLKFSFDYANDNIDYYKAVPVYKDGGLNTYIYYLNDFLIHVTVNLECDASLLGGIGTNSIAFFDDNGNNIDWAIFDNVMSFVSEGNSWFGINNGVDYNPNNVDILYYSFGFDASRLTVNGDTYNRYNSNKCFNVIPYTLHNYNMPSYTIPVKSNTIASYASSNITVASLYQKNAAHNNSNYLKNVVITDRITELDIIKYTVTGTSNKGTYLDDTYMASNNISYSGTVNKLYNQIGNTNILFPFTDIGVIKTGTVYKGFITCTICKGIVAKKVLLSENIKGTVTKKDIILSDLSFDEAVAALGYGTYNSALILCGIISSDIALDMFDINVYNIDSDTDNKVNMQLMLTSKDENNSILTLVNDTLDNNETDLYDIISTTGIILGEYITEEAVGSIYYVIHGERTLAEVSKDKYTRYVIKNYYNTLYSNGKIYQGIFNITGNAVYYKYIDISGLYIQDVLTVDHDFYTRVLPLIQQSSFSVQNMYYDCSKTESLLNMALGFALSDSTVRNDILAQDIIDYCHRLSYDVICMSESAVDSNITIGVHVLALTRKGILNIKLENFYISNKLSDLFNITVNILAGKVSFNVKDISAGYNMFTVLYAYADIKYKDKTYRVYNYVSMIDGVPTFTLKATLVYNCAFVPPRLMFTSDNPVHNLESNYIKIKNYKDGVFTLESKNNDGTKYTVAYNSNTQEVVLYYKDYILPVDNANLPALRDNTYLRDDLGMSSFIYKNRVLDYLAFTRSIDTIISAKLYGAYSSDSNFKLTSILDKKAVFNYTGLPIAVQGTHEFNLADFDIEENVGYLQCYSTDINSASLERKHLAKIDTKEEYQLVKQAWNTTTAIENYWWITEDKILYLTKDKFILVQKEDKLDHWNGDKWTEIKSYDRTKFLPSTVVQYGVANLNGKCNEGAMLWALSPYSDDTFTLVLYRLLDNLSQPVDDVQFGEFSFEIVKRNIGSKLNVSYTDNKLYSYSGANVYDLLANARVSTAQIVDGVISKFIIGIHADNNFNQWALSCDLNNVHWNIIQGYGFVGIDGSLTGGEIPDKYFTVSSNGGGFTGTVEDLNTLSTVTKEINNAAELSQFNTRVVGNENQQWYIDTSIDGIVSHITFDSKNGNFVKHILPILNNYTYCYESPSFITRVAGDMALQMKALLSMIPAVNKQNQWIWNLLFGFIGAPLAYYINPKISYVNYLQQTFGQYAYVHYNSTSLYQAKDLSSKDVVSPLESADTDTAVAVTKDELSFDIVTISQEQDCGSSPWDEFFYLLGTALTTALDYTKEKLKVNEAQNQSATTDKGKKYSQMFLKNVDSMMKDAFTSKSYTSTLSSEVTMLKTLDMFYSTAASQKICAGPGFVNHNFVAQCVAQSMVSTQLEANQLSMLAIFTPLTTIQMRLELQILKKTITFLQEQVKAWGGPLWAVAGAGSTGKSFPTLASVFAVLAKALELTYITIELAIPAVEDILNALGGNHITSTITNTMSNHNVQIEPKHRYGSNSEVFMWPCFDCKDNVYVREKVVADTESKPWKLSMNPVSKYSMPAANEAVTSLRKKLSRYNNGWSLMYSDRPTSATVSPSSNVELFAYGDVDYRVAVCRGVTEDVVLPTDMACVIGAENFLPADNFKNENISESEPVFAVPVIQDYMLSEDWKLAMTCTDGEIAWVSCKDTKLIDGAPSNVIVSDDFCGIASPYTAIEVKRELSVDYLRPWAVTPNVLALNVTGLNTAFDNKMYHAFDGYGYRITNWYGSAGMNKEKYTLLYDFQINDRFKRSNKLPPNQFLGNFKSTPDTSIQSLDKVFCQVMVPSENEGTYAGTVGEDKDVIRYALPIFSEFVSTLPAIVKTLSSYKLAVVDGVTSLCTDLRNTQSAYKTSVSTDFNIGTEQYRVTNDYICSVKNEQGVTIVTELVATLGLTYIGATLTEAYFYSSATRKYYSYTGGANLNAVDMLERFRDIKNGIWDFVDHTVIMPCLATFDRLDSNVHDDADETDNIIIPMIANNEFAGEVTPPVTTIFNTDSWFRTLSLPAGLTFQGPNRCIINRFIFMEYMTDGIKSNRGKWVRVPKEKYHPFRTYREEYKEVTNSVNEPDNVNGWTHNPFLLVTAPLGVNEETDCLFEWEITFAWTVEMDKIYEQQDYVCVNIMSETMTPGGKVYSRPTHVYLTKELFTRTGNYGYYSFRYEGNNGIGNRERLHIWADGYIAVSSVQVEYKPMTTKRQTKLTQYVDVQHLNEF